MTTPDDWIAEQVGTILRAASTVITPAAIADITDAVLALYHARGGHPDPINRALARVRELCRVADVNAANELERIGKHARTPYS